MQYALGNGSIHYRRSRNKTILKFGNFLANDNVKKSLGFIANCKNCLFMLLL